jgi:leader peptidase (prepilin peptidase)/N-methyltransferase
VRTTGRRHVVVVSGGLCGCALAAVGQPAWAALAIVAGLAAVVPVDVRERRIPTPVVAAATIATTTSIVITALGDESWPVAALAVSGTLIVGGVFLLVHLLHPAGLGFGDVRLGAVAGGLVAYGTGNPATAVATAGLAALIAAVVTLASRSRSIPFAPFLLATALAALAVAAS